MNKEKYFCTACLNCFEYPAILPNGNKHRDGTNECCPYCKAGKYTIIGVDGYNQSVTGNIAKTLTSINSDYHHVPCVLEINGFIEIEKITFKINDL